MAQRIVSGIMMVGLLICLSSAVRAQAQAQAPKIGFVNSAKILQEYPEAIDANKKLDAMQKKWQADLEKMSKDLQGQIEDYQKKEPLLKDDEKKSRQADLSDQQQKVLQFQKEKFGNDGALAVATDSLLRPIKQKVIKVIEAISKEKHIQFMFDRNEQIMVLLYGEPKYDYTNLVIDRLTRGD
ncbi:MAG TPA: OmpH family outer membrane protein [Bacteroidota bacterium]|nr:OmpH family outer membrane protein [Bacteroidota bacterium]